MEVPSIVTLAVSGLHAEEWTFVSSVGCPMHDDFIALGDGVVDGEILDREMPCGLSRCGF